MDSVAHIESGRGRYTINAYTFRRLLQFHGNKEKKKPNGEPRNVNWERGKIHSLGQKF